MIAFNTSFKSNEFFLFRLLEKARNLKQRNKSARTQYMSSEIRERNNSDNEKGVAIRNQMEENV